MHTGTLRKLALALTFWLALHCSTLRAQIFTAPLQASTTGTNPVDFEFRADGTMIAKGNIGVGSLLSGDQGTGTRMLWFPSLGAFRAGGVNTTDWDASNIGQYSVAFGWNSTASGLRSIALGNTTKATGTDSVALGRANATASYAFALGSGTASAPYATALGGSNAFGSASTSTGSSTASGGNSTALGASTASGYASIALGRQAAAVGDYSTAIGSYSHAYGQYTVVAGTHVKANAFESFVTGVYNLAGGTSGSWVSTDPLFEVGNGTSTTPSDAMVVYKNGSADFQGPVTVAPAGDIPMYTGN